MKGLVIGRFQPLTIAHVELMKRVDQIDLEKILLGIGTDPCGRSERNPFTYDEVKQMWLPELEYFQTPVEIYDIPDINDSENYAAHVERVTGCSEKNTMVLSGNPDTLKCFTDYKKNYATYVISRASPTEEGHLSATMVRDGIKNDEGWERLVPESTKQYIESIGGVDRIKRLGG
jgi:nicotinamide-nucleotide adenylyltransferase